MIKVLIFAKRKAGLDHAAFRDHYETVHAPLSVSEMPFLRGYARNFPVPVPGKPEADFDVLTEMWFDDREGFQKTMAHLLDPETGRSLQEDGDKFMDRTSTRLIVVEECVSDIKGAAA